MEQDTAFTPVFSANVSLVLRLEHGRAPRLSDQSDL
jgi:hypothetical protein